MSRDTITKTEQNSVKPIIKSINQTNDQSSLLLSRIKNSTNKIVLQDASGRKSTTVHLKALTKSMTDKTLPQLQQIQHAQGTKNAVNAVTTQNRPQIVYIKSNSIGNSTILRPSSSIPNLVTSIIKPVNQLSVIKPSSNPILKNYSVQNSVANNLTYDAKYLNDSNKNDEKLDSVKFTTVTTESSKSRVVIKSNALTSLQNSNNGLSHVKVSDKGSVVSLQTSDSRKNQCSAASAISVDDTKILNLPPLQPIKKEKTLLINKSNNCAKVENDSGKCININYLNSANNLHGMTSVLKKHLGCNNNKILDNNLDKLTNNAVDNSNSGLSLESDKANSTDKSNGIRCISPLKSQPRIKKQQLQVKEDALELCIEVLKPKQQKDVKKRRKCIMKETDDYDEFYDNPMKNLSWKNGIGTLDNTNLHFQKNEFGLFDLLSEMEYDALTTGRKDSKYHTPLAKRNEIQNNVKKSTSADDLYECYTCSSLGPAIEFISPEFCSSVCADIYKGFKNQANKANEGDGSYEQKRSQIVISDDSDTEVDGKSSRYSWMPTNTRGFSWSKYMNFKKTKPAPIKLFKEPFPFISNGFKVGMKLEGIDPWNESLICVMSIVDIKGFRICLHFDSYSTKYDFWINADSNNIFPPGWCEKNNHALTLPKFYTLDSFNWTAYLRQCRSLAAPRMLFPHLACETVYSLGFRIGMKLEALDKKHSRKMCVATVTDVLVTERFLVHFDGRDKMFDYWADPTSPYVHPVGWCKENQISLVPPAGNNSETNFDWEKYLNQTNSSAVPTRAFKARPITGFQVGMKLEAVDTRVPYLIRVATIAEVKEYSIKISFDGWPPRYSIWVDIDSPDIHPVGWCTKTGHNLEPPLMPEDVQNSLSIGCGVPGCNGEGHTGSQHQSKHFAIINCPFAPKNLNLILEKGLRYRLLNSEDEKLSSKVILSGNNKRKIDDESSSGSISKNPKLDSGGTNIDGISTEGRSMLSIKSEPCNGKSSTCVGKLNLRENNFLPRRNYELSLSQIKMDEESKSVYTSVFEPEVLPSRPSLDRFLWLRYTKPLSYVIKKSYRDLDPRLWSSHDVVNFVRNIPNCSSIAHKFEGHNIDGECFVMLTQQDLITHCNLRIGQAVKIYNSILILREQVLN